VPYNVIDKPALCQFQFGSIVNRSPVVVGISTSGAAPILGQAVRRRIETLLPRTLSQWADVAAKIRDEVMERLAPGPERRAFWERFADMAFGAAAQADPKSLIAAVADAAQQLYGILEWAPSRLLAGAYALAGSFDEAMAERRAYYAECSGRFFEINEDILACTGRGALALESDGVGEIEALESTANLLFRALVIWLAVLALLSLIGWS
jgi:hypothetical protein